MASQSFDQDAEYVSMCEQQENDQPANDQRTNLIVNYFPEGLPEQEFREIFTVFGPITSCRLVWDHQTNKVTGYGFVDYVKPEDAVRAQTTMNGKYILDKQLKVTFARPSSECMPDTNLYVRNILPEWTVNELDGFFSRFGKIVTSRILTDKITGQSLGKGFVRFETRRSAADAMSTLRIVIPPGHSTPLLIELGYGGRNSHKNRF